MIFYFISLIQVKSQTAGNAISVIIALKLCKNTKKNAYKQKTFAIFAQFKSKTMQKWRMPTQTPHRCRLPARNHPGLISAYSMDHNRLVNQILRPV